MSHTHLPRMRQSWRAKFSGELAMRMPPSLWMNSDKPARTGRRSPRRGHNMLTAALENSFYRGSLRRGVLSTGSGTSPVGFGFADRQRSTLSCTTKTPVTFPSLPPIPTCHVQGRPETSTGWSPSPTFKPSNGAPVMGLHRRAAVNILLFAAPTPGQAIADATRSASATVSPTLSSRA